MKKISFFLIIFWSFSEASFADDLVIDSSIIYQSHNRALSMGNAMVSAVPTSELATRYNIAGVVKTDEDLATFDLLLGGQLSFDKTIIDEFNKATERDFDTSQEVAQAARDEKIFLLSGQGWGHLSFQFQLFEGIGVQRLGFAAERYFTALGILSFSTLNQDEISITDPKKATQLIDDSLKKNLDFQMTPEEKKKLEEEIQTLKDDNQSDMDQAQKIFNLVWKTAINFQTALIDIQSSGGAISLFDDTLRVGMLVRQYVVKVRNVQDYTLVSAIANSDNISTLAEEKQDEGIGKELGILYRPSPESAYQFGITYQNIGGVKFEKANMEIPASLNAGASLHLDFELASFLGAFEVKDMLTETTYTIKGEKEVRSFGQRSHVGMQVGLFPLFGNHILYLGAGLNQELPSYGFQINLPWNLIRLGYTKYEGDLGNRNNQRTYNNDVIFGSIGISI